jgi:hypothetical protein
MSVTVAGFPSDRNTRHAEVRVSSSLLDAAGREPGVPVALKQQERGDQRHDGLEPAVAWPISLRLVFERADAAFVSARDAVSPIVDALTGVGPGWLVAGVLLHGLHQVIRSRGWFTIIRAAYPDAPDVRARDVTCAYLAGTGLNGVVPARGGDLAKLYLVRRRVPQASWSTLAATLVPETLFETAVGVGLVMWALTAGFLPAPASPADMSALYFSAVIEHPLLAAVGALAASVAAAVLVRVLRRRARSLWAHVIRGLAILQSPRRFACGVVSWQLLGRILRLGSLACFIAAFGLPVTLGTAVLVMAAQGAGRIIPLAAASTGLRIAMLAYGFNAIAGEPVDLARVTAFSIGVGTTVSASGLAIAILILGRQLDSRSPRAIVSRLRERLEEAPAAPSRAPAS